MRIVIVPKQKGTPVGKLADSELHFDRRDGTLLDGLRTRSGGAVRPSLDAMHEPEHPHELLVPKVVLTTTIAATH